MKITSILGLVVLSVAVGAVCDYKLRDDLKPTPARISRDIDTSNTEVLFSPRGGCTEAVVAEIGKAKKSVFVLAYSFTSKPIADALVDAKKRGVDVRIVLDKSDADHYSLLGYVVSNGIPTLVDYKHAIAHSKVMIIDDQVVITGSFNFSVAAEKENAENMLVIHSSKLADTYTANWKVHAGHSDAPVGTPVTKPSKPWHQEPARPSAHRLTKSTLH